MLIQRTPPLHLTYCLNIHPGETWAENLAAIRAKAGAVKQFLAMDQPFGLGLRLAAQAVDFLEHDVDARVAALAVFHELGMYPFTVNAFPYGRFHAGPVKENVYAPDWRKPERRDYTIKVADILSPWLPDGVEGSISTVPGSYKAWITELADMTAMAKNLAAVAAHLAKMRESTGRTIHLGLEPEPDCFLQTTPETIHFFEDVLFTEGRAEMERLLGCSASEAEACMRRHIGVCFDTCHVALQYEDPLASLNAYRDAGILISKVQLSAALMLKNSPEAWEALRAFNEPVYLHQVKARLTDGSRRSWPDLGPALADTTGHEGVEEMRCHFHVPLFFKESGPLQSTASTLTPEFFKALRNGATPHAEIETYTFDVLPPEVHPGDLTQSIAREYTWVLERL